MSVVGFELPNVSLVLDIGHRCRNRVRHETEKQNVMDTISISDISKLSFNRVMDTISISDISKLSFNRVMDTISISDISKLSFNRAFATESKKEGLKKVNSLPFIEVNQILQATPPKIGKRRGKVRQCGVKFEFLVVSVF